MGERNQYTFRRADVTELIDLRHCVLRAGLPREMASFGGDDLETTLHFGVFDEHNSLLCCVTMLRSEYDGAPAWQLRGMATADQARSTGIGSKLVPFAEAAAFAATGVVPVWCNARQRAVPFYERLGYRLRERAV
jgi:GNAT superfamily N-acetyltransferase